MSDLPVLPETPGLSRRQLRRAVAVVGGATGAGALLGPTPGAFGAPGLRKSRPANGWGVQSGDVTASSG